MGDFVLPKGSLACSSPALVHRMSHIYPEPDNFDPQRMLGEKETRQEAAEKLAAEVAGTTD